MSKIYLSYDPEQKLLLPPDLREWMPEGHLAPFISDVVDELDLSGIVGSYESGDGRYGKGVRGDEVPAELARRESRLRKIREAKAALEAEAKEKAKAREDAAASRGQADNGPRTAILR
jgi:hypothetical protein